MANITAPSASWENRSRGPAVSLGVLIIDADGDWAITDAPGTQADGFLADDAGELVIDDAAGARRPIYLGGTLVVL